MADPPSSLQRRTGSASDPSHKRAVSSRNVKIGDHRRPLKSTLLQDSLIQKKLGSRIADLESQLGQAQHELKLLKCQLVTPEAAKKQHLGKPKKAPNAKPEVPVKPVMAEAISEERDAHEKKPEMELMILKAKLEEKERELKEFHGRNESLKRQLSGDLKEEEMSERISKLGEELKSSKAAAAELTESLEAAKEANKALEEEMKMMRVQTEQWRKAADAAAAVLAGDAGTNGGSVLCTASDRYGCFEDFQEIEDGGEKPKGYGMRISDLWKKKNAKQNS